MLSVGVIIGTIAWVFSYDWFSILLPVLVLTSICIALVQWIILRKYIVNANWWLPATLLGSIIGSLIGWISAIIFAFVFGVVGDQVVNSSFGDVLGGAVGCISGGFIAGFILGFAQWIVLRRSFKTAYGWIFVSAVSYSIAAIFGANINRTIGALGSVGGLVTATVTTTVIGMVTGVMLIILMSRGPHVNIGITVSQLDDVAENGFH